MDVKINTRKFNYDFTVKTDDSLEYVGTYVSKETPGYCEMNGSVIKVTEPADASSMEQRDYVGNFYYSKPNDEENSQTSLNISAAPAYIDVIYKGITTCKEQVEATIKPL